MRRVLWIGDAVVATGFARVTHKVCDVLRQSWDVQVLGLNYYGDPHPYPYPIYPAIVGGDAFGVRRVDELVKALKPDVIVILNDPWNIREYLKYVGETAKTVASMPVDGKNCRGTWINGLDLGIFWTQFGLDEARAGGFAKPASVVPLGIDLNLYQPMNRVAARRAIGLPPELDKAFIVGNVNRNQPRKRLDLTVKYFAKWVEESGATDAYLYLHVAPTGDVGYDVQQLMQYYGFKGKNKRLIFVEPKIGPGVPEAMLTQVYSSFDVQVTTTQGEGWGLPTMEGMACGVPQIVPVWAALGEWCEDAVVRIHCDSTIVTPNGINAVGGVPMERTFISALDLFYQDRTFGEKYAKRGLDLVRQPRFRWSEIGLRYAEVLAALGTEEVAAAAVSA